MVDVQTISILFAGLSIAASILYYASVLQNANKTRKAQLFLSIYNITLQEEMNKKWTDAMTANTEVDHDKRQDWHTLWQKYNGIGHLLMQGLLDVESAYHYSESWRGALLWMKWREVIIGSRERGTNPDYMDGFEYLAEKMMEYRAEKGLPNELPSRFQT